MSRPREAPVEGDRLADLPPGARARVAGIVAGESRIDRRLAHLGFTPGTPVRVVRRAPLGDPIEFELRGYRVCLRHSEARRIRIAPA